MSLFLLGWISFSSQTIWAATKSQKKIVSQGTQTALAETESALPKCKGYYSANFRSWKGGKHSRIVVSSREGEGKGTYHYFQVSSQDEGYSLQLRDELSGDTVPTQGAWLTSGLFMFRARVDHFPEDVDLEEEWERPLLLVFCANDLNLIQKLK